jgi:hypothetical protein
MLMYPVAYMVVWLMPTGVRIYQTVKGIPAPFALQTVDKVRLVSPHIIWKGAADIKVHSE